MHSIAYCILAVLCFFVRMSYRIEIINTTNVANAIINDNVSYTLMLIISLSRGKLGFSSDALSFRLQTMIKVWKNGSTTKKQFSRKHNIMQYIEKSYDRIICNTYTAVAFLFIPYDIFDTAFYSCSVTYNCNDHECARRCKKHGCI